MSQGVPSNFAASGAAAGNAAAPVAAGGKGAGKGLGFLAAIPIIGDMLSNIGAGKRERQARAYNKKMWHLQNAYNHPSQQMARLQEAGLNPRLIYGSSSGSASGNAGAIAPGKAPEYKLSGANAISAYNNLRATTAQTQNLDAMSRLNDSAATLNYAKLPGENAKSLVAMQTMDDAIKQIRSNANIAAQDFKIKLLNYNIKSEQKKALIEQAYQDLNVSIAQEGLLLANTNLSKANVRKAFSQIDLNKVMAKNYVARTEVEKVLVDIKKQILAQETYWSSVLPLGRKDADALLLMEMIEDIGKEVSISGVPFAKEIGWAVTKIGQLWSARKKTNISNVKNITVNK